MKILLVGAGPMAAEYAKVLAAENISFETVGRGDVSARAFTERTGRPVTTGGLSARLTRDAAPLPGTAIVAVGPEALAETALFLLSRGVKRILLEKPAGLDAAEIRSVAAAARRSGGEVFVAYNRRFYASALRARELIAEDGGVTSFHFEFTEWSAVIEKLTKAPKVKEAWFLVNSTHVIDLAFHLGGAPKSLRTLTAGKNALAWHPQASIFAGSGVSAAGALFTYKADWGAPGRWGVEVMTRRRRLVLRPLEELQVQRHGSLALDKEPLAGDDDLRFKPGLRRQTLAFLDGRCPDLLSIEEQLRRAETLFLAIAAPDEKHEKMPCL